MSAYRCDTFVLDLFAFTNIRRDYDCAYLWGDSRGTYWPIPRVITGDPLNWRNNISLPFSSTSRLPLTIYDRLKSF